MDIVNNIIGNPKRMAKLAKLARYYDICDKAKAYIVAECRENKVNMSESEITAAAVEIAERVWGK